MVIQHRCGNRRRSCDQENDSGNRIVVLHTAALSKSSKAVDLFFIGADGIHFRATMICRPYFYLKVKEGSEVEVELALKKYFRDKIYSIRPTELHDQSAPNHVASMSKRPLLVVECRTMADLNEMSQFVLRKLEEFKTTSNLLLEESKENEHSLAYDDSICCMKTQF